MIKLWSLISLFFLNKWPVQKFEHSFSFLFYRGIFQNEGSDRWIFFLHLCMKEFLRSKYKCLHLSANRTHSKARIWQFNCCKSTEKAQVWPQRSLIEQLHDTLSECDYKLVIEQLCDIWKLTQANLFCLEAGKKHAAPSCQSTNEMKTREMRQPWQRDSMRDEENKIKWCGKNKMCLYLNKEAAVSVYFYLMKQLVLFSSIHITYIFFSTGIYSLYLKQLFMLGYFICNSFCLKNPT